MLPRARLTSHSKTSGSRWVITPLWLHESWRSFLYTSSVYSWHLFLTSWASVRSIPFLSFIVTIFVWNVPLVSLIFLKRPPVFPILLFSSLFFIVHLLRLSYLSLLFFATLLSDGCVFPFLLCFLLLFFSRLFVRPPLTTTLPFCISLSWGWSPSLLPCTVKNLHPNFFRHSIRSKPLSLFFVTFTVQYKGFDLGHRWMF